MTITRLFNVLFSLRRWETNSNLLKHVIVEVNNNIQEANNPHLSPEQKTTLQCKHNTLLQIKKDLLELITGYVAAYIENHELFPSRDTTTEGGQKNQELGGNFSQKQEEIEELKTSLDQLKNQLKAIANDEGTHDASQESKQPLDRINQDFVEPISSKEKEIDNQGISLKELETSVSELKKKLETDSKSIVKGEEENKKLRDQIEELIRERTELEKENTDLQKTVNASGPSLELEENFKIPELRKKKKNPKTKLSSSFLKDLEKNSSPSKDMGLTTSLHFNGSTQQETQEEEIDLILALQTLIKRLEDEVAVDEEDLNTIKAMLAHNILEEEAQSKLNQEIKEISTRLEKNIDTFHDLYEWKTELVSKLGESQKGPEFLELDPTKTPTEMPHEENFAESPLKLLGGDPIKIDCEDI